MILLLAAMQPEVDACLGCLRELRRSTIEGFSVIEGDVAVVCQTGLGRRADHATDAMLRRFSPAAVFSIGTAGGLSPELTAGEVVVCERVDRGYIQGTDSEEPAVSADAHLLTAALRVAEECGLPARTGRSVTVDSVAWGPEEKAGLRSWRGHDIVEMESYWVGRAALASSLPFLAVRVVSDQADDRIPEVPGLVTEDGSIDYSRFLPYVREHPELIPDFAQQVERSRLAIGNLTTFLTQFLPRLAGFVRSNPQAAG